MKNCMTALALSGALALVALTPAQVFAGQKQPTKPVATPDEFKARVIRQTDLPMTELVPGSNSRLVAGEQSMISFLKMDKGSYFAPHRHHQEQIMIVLEGYCDEIIEGKLYRVQKGDVIILPSNIEHGAYIYDQDVHVIGLTTVKDNDYATFFGNLRAAGWTAVEAASDAWLSRPRPDSEIREVKAQSKANNVVLYGLHCAGNIIAPDPDADRWQRHIIDSIRAAESLGCELILTHAGSMYPNRNWAHPQNWSRESWTRTVNALKRICKDTAGSKVEIAIEAVNTESVNNPWAHKRLREDVGDPRITVGLDITNMVHPGVAFRMTELINTTFDLLEDQIRYVHAKDFAKLGVGILGTQS